MITTATTTTTVTAALDDPTRDLEDAALAGLPSQ